MTTQSPVLRRSRAAQWTGPRTPARLRRIGVVLTLASLVTAVLSLVGGTTRTSAVTDVGNRDTSLTQVAGEVYQALADADAMATSGYVSAGQEPAAVRTRYDADVTRAGQRLAQASRQVGPDDPAAKPLDTMITGLPAYAGLIETARTYNRQGLPLGQSYLAQASTQMRTQLLPAAEELRRAEVTELNADYRQASALPVAVVLFGLALLIAALDFSRKEFRRTRRRLNLGVVAACVAVVAGLLWWVVATASTDSALAEANKASDAATALDEARTFVLQARSNENLVLVARSGGSASDQGFTDQLDRLRADDGPLAKAAANGVDVSTIRTAARAWTAAHKNLRTADDAGRYADAVQAAVGTGKGSSGAAFTALDKAVSDAGGTARARLAAATDDASGATTLLAFGPTVLFALAAAGFAIGVARRVEEYR
ncbi:hypothetical protein [Labedaea rhizosphaerae]|uniref:Secreted protein n=1 Tax=Labedaea rhizosphaerae TaxID=598644 RepID=A0A4R6S0D5_LABRH|nr:hypothetical protein [Labedaea rhizosphaerae]TDP92942.1 hypothetical protein EV186_107177 [Labedaea rhizosphaerae]